MLLPLLYRLTRAFTPFSATERSNQIHIIPPELQTTHTPPALTRSTKIYPSLSSPKEPPVALPKPKLTALRKRAHPDPPLKLHITSHDEADQALIASLQDRVESLPSAKSIHSEIGKSSQIGLMHPTSHALNHPATPILQDYAAAGCPVDCGPHWTKQQIEETLQYGAHPSAKKAAAREYLVSETNAKVQEGFAKLVRYGDIKSNLPPKLKLSPVAMVPHKSRAYRVILDLSFHLRSAHHPHPSVNDATTPQAPVQAMHELGNVLKRILATLADGHNSDPTKSFMFSKLDIKDGFWRMIVSEEDAWNFCYAIPPPSPDTPLDDIQIVVPNSLQMGWCESPPFFCAATETGRDVIESLLDTTLPAHKFENKMLPINFNSLPRQCADLLSTTTLIEVYVDDYIACIDNISRKHIQQVSRAMLHGIHSIFPPPTVTGHNGGDPISEKKLDKLEGQWAHIKEILGWIVDGVNFTIRLPLEKITKIKRTLRILRSRRSIKIKEFQKITGTLNHAAYGMPGGRGLFTVLWKALAKESRGYVTVTPEVKQAFQDFTWLFSEMANNPVHVAQLVQRDPHCNGYSDACKWGAGGVWIIPQADGSNLFLFWSIPFPQAIIDRFESGLLSINDLELAGIVLHWLVLEHLLPSLQFVSAGIQCDNSSSVAWTKKIYSTLPHRRIPPPSFGPTPTDLQISPTTCRSHCRHPQHHG